MTWRLRRHDPSFSSINEKSFESRRVRTHPRTKIAEIGAVLCKAFFIEMGESATGSLIIQIRKPGIQQKQPAWPVLYYLENRSAEIVTIYLFGKRICCCDRSRRSA